MVFENASGFPHFSPRNIYRSAAGFSEGSEHSRKQRGREVTGAGERAFSQLSRSEIPVTGVAESGNDVGIFIEAFVE